MPIDPALAKKIDREILNGLPSVAETRRRQDARVNLDFYHGRVEQYAPKVSYGDDWEKIRPRRSRLMQRLINVLTNHLYRSGPKRSLPDHPEASEWLEAVYRQNNVDAILQTADRLSMAADAVAIQVVPSSDPMCPVSFLLWDAYSFIVWLDPDDQRKPVAVAILDEYDAQRRLRLYTDATVRTYLTQKLQEGQTAGGTAYTFRGERPNPFGVLPFAFIHYTMPITEFWNIGPGTHFREANENVDAILTQTGGAITYNLVPLLVAKNFEPGTSFPKPIKPGAIMYVNGKQDDVASSASEPDASYLQADSSFVAASWEDLQSYIDHTLEMAGVPRSAIRMEQDAVRSGVSIVAEQIPLIEWAESRQRPFARYEDDLAKLTLTVGSRHLEANAELDAEYAATSEQLAAAAENPGLQLRWPKMTPELPGAELDQADQWLLDNGLASRTTVVMRRQNMTREEAEAYLEEIAEDVKREHKLFGEADMEQAKTDAAKAKLMAEATADPNEAKEPKPDTDEDD